MKDSTSKERNKNKFDFIEARNGDHLLVPFECDTCIFRKLKKRDPITDSYQDQLLQVMVRRMNLDAFWSRARSTVGENTRRVRQTLKFSKMLGLEGPYEHQGPYPLEDHCGYQIAACILLHSTQKGRYNQDYTQFETIRKLRTSFASHNKTLPKSNMINLTMSDNKGKYARISSDKCGSLWFSRFMIGLKIRMGSVTRPNKALTIELMLLLLNKVEDKIYESQSPSDEHRWTMFGIYIAISYVLSLRGNEGLMLDLNGLRKTWNVKRKDYVTIVLYGKLKGENSFREHLIPCCNVTKSGINVRGMINRAIKLKEKEGLTRGPLISDESGLLFSTKDLDNMLQELLIDLFEVHKHSFPPTITSVEDIQDYYKCFRTFRRTSNTRAQEENVDLNDINIVNRWDQTAAQQRNKISQPMHHHYAQFELLLKPFIRYTTAM